MGIGGLFRFRGYGIRLRILRFLRRFRYFRLRRDRDACRPAGQGGEGIQGGVRFLADEEGGVPPLGGRLGGSSNGRLLWSITGEIPLAGLPVGFQP